MKKIILILILVVSFTSCKSSKSAANTKSKTTKTKTTRASSSASTSKKINAIIDHAKTFKGTRYKYGGTTKRGMDCSGLIVAAFNKVEISLPRTTNDLSKQGNWIDVKDVREGDLLFFATRKNNRNVNHVGIVTRSRPGFVEFIHSTTSQGVIISKLSERYWYLAYVQARRVM